MTGSYRNVIEVMKFLSPFDVLKHSATVLSQWHQVSDSNELWFSFFPIPPDPSVSFESAKSFYEKMYKASVFVVQDNRILRYFVTSHVWTEVLLRHPVDIDVATSVTRVSNNQLFCCGATSPSANTYLIRTDSGEVQKLQYLTPHRIGMGVIFYQGIVYAFGGSHGNKHLVQSAKYNVNSSGWGKLPNLTVERSYFNPCRHKSKIYLLGGSSNSSSGEIYNIRKNVFTAFPSDFDFNYSVSVIRDSTIQVISDFVKAEHRLSSKGSWSIQTMPKALYLCFWSGFDPILLESKLFVLQRNEARLVELDLDTLNWNAFPYAGEKRCRFKKKGKR